MRPFRSVVKTVILSVNQLPFPTAKPLKLCTPLAWLSASIIIVSVDKTQLLEYFTVCLSQKIVFSLGGKMN